LLATVTTQAQTGLFRGADHILITRGSNIVFSFDSLGFRNAQGQRLLDSLANVIMNRVRDSANVWMTLGPRKLTESLVNAVGVTDGYVLTAVTGVATWSAPVAGGWDVDSAAALMTVGPRKLTTALLQPGTDGDVLITAAGVAFWQADPPLARGASQFFYWTSILAQTVSDTASDKHVAYCGQISREWPVPHGTTFSAISAALFVRSGTFATYSANMTTVGSGATAVTQGDRFLMRFFPGGGTGTDKYVKLYRIPSTYAWMGGTVGVNKRYGEYIGYWLIPAALFPASGTVNMECELSMKVK
jgi:hypothetical protein